MMWANLSGARVEAFPEGRAKCPCCGDEVLAKCGDIVTWHWAHICNDCDPWYESESQWHIGWKRKFPKEWQEVVMAKHRADIKTPRLVLELQSSPISTKDIETREIFYGRMVWLLKGEDFEKNISFRNRGEFVTFRWYWPRKSWWYAQRPVMIDMGTWIFELKKIYSHTPCGGWGLAWSVNDFLVRCGLNPTPNPTTP